MESEEIIERLFSRAYYCYKKCFRKLCPQISVKLDRKVPVVINDVEYRGWRELVVVNMGKLIQDYCPDADVEIELDGNDSVFKVENLTDKDEEVLNEKLNLIFEGKGE